MSRRDALLRATAGALQPKSLDLTKYRQKSIRDRTIGLRAEDAAGALAFAAMDQYEGEDGKPCAVDADGAQRLPGDPFKVDLLVLKYVDQHSRERFDRAWRVLFKRHSNLTRRRNCDTLAAIATAALFEWLHDDCPKCRKRRKQATPKPCPCSKVVPRCGSPRPQPGCPKCKGIGRIFDSEQRRRAGRCVACSSSGRRAFTVKERWFLVNDYLKDAQAMRGQPVVGIKLETFKVSHWAARYYRFMDVLHTADRGIVSGLDVGFQATPRRDAESCEEAPEDDD